MIYVSGRVPGEDGELGAQRVVKLCHMAAVGERVVDEQRHRHLQAALGVWRKRAPGEPRGS